MIKNMEKDDFKHECCSHWHPHTPLLQLAVMEHGIPRPGAFLWESHGAHLPLQWEDGYQTTHADVGVQRQCVHGAPTHLRGHGQQLSLRLLTKRKQKRGRKLHTQVFTHMARKCLEPRSCLVSSVLHEPHDFRELTHLSDLCCCRFACELPSALAALVPCIPVPPIMLFNTPCLPLPVALTQFQIKHFPRTWILLVYRSPGSQEVLAPSQGHMLNCLRTVLLFL